MSSKRLDLQAFFPAHCCSGAAQSLGGFPAAILDIPAAAELLPMLGHESGWAATSPGSCDQRSTCYLGWAMLKEVLHGPCGCVVEPVVDIWTFQRHVLKALRSMYFGCKNGYSSCWLLWSACFGKKKSHTLNQVMVAANLQPFHKSMRVINPFMY